MCFVRSRHLDLAGKQAKFVASKICLTKLFLIFFQFVMKYFQPDQISQANFSL